MGIPGFASWLRERYPEAFCELGPNSTFDNIYIDLQSTLHMVTRKARNRHGFHLLLHRRLDTLLATLSPTERVVLAMDGPAPLAKLLEQRRRRRRESDRSENAEKEGVAAANEAAAAAAAAGGDNLASTTDAPRSSRERSRSYNHSTNKNAVSPLFLTTGTVFMLEVHNSLVYYICQRLTDPRFKHLHFELSDSTVKGEGELKILSRLLHSAAAEENDQNASEQTHAVVGGDSDLLIMAIASGQRHVMLWDDVPNRRHRTTCAFNRDKLETIWRKTHLSEDATQSDIADLGLDLALLAIIASGNDYLPGCQGLGLQNKGRPGLWSLYLDMRNQPEWKGRSLIKRICNEGCGSGSLDGDNDATTTAGGLEGIENEDVFSNKNNGDGGNADLNSNDSEVSRVCPGGVYVTIDRPVLSALLRRYTDQRFALADTNGNGNGGNSFSGVKQISGAWNFGMKRKPTGAGSNTNGSSKNGTSDDSSVFSTPGSPVNGINTGRDHQSIYTSRPPADTEAYIEGLEWVLTMYGTGSVSDYRFSYPAAPPSVVSFIETLEGIHTGVGDDTEMAEAGAGAEGGTVAGSVAEDFEGEVFVQKQESIPRVKTSRAGLQPLIPAACALALLPARSRRQAATPLRHLMDADSPVAEIYAVCKECQALSTEVRSVSAQMDEVRTKLAALQHKLGSAAPDADGVHDVEGDLTAAAEVFEAAQDKLKIILRELSRSQQEHFKEKHPFKPFPTDVLEAAVTAVTTDQYPPRERRLARFGREMVFRSGEFNVGASEDSFSATSSIDGEDFEEPLQQEQFPLSENVATAAAGAAAGDGPFKPYNKYNNNPNTNNSNSYTSSLLETNVYLGLPGWLKDASRFAAAYPRIGSQDIVLGASYGVVREVLPLHPYMQPGVQRARNVVGGGRAGVGGHGGQGSSNSSSSSGPTAMYMACQIRRYNNGTSNTGILDLASTFVGGASSTGTNMWGRSLRSWRSSSGGGGGGFAHFSSSSIRSYSSSFSGLLVPPFQRLSSSGGISSGFAMYAGGMRVVSLQQHRGNSRLMQAALNTCARVLPRLRALC